MKVRVIKLLGREILRLETYVEATVSDVVQAMLAVRLAGTELVAEDEEEDLIECECCGEMFDPAEAEEQTEVDERFADIAWGLNWGERLVWDTSVAEEEDES